MHRSTLLWLMLAIPLGGCSGHANEPNLLAEDPTLRVRAIVQIAERQDHSQINGLVDRLEDEAEEVRLYAILALRQLTGGQDFGYQAYGAPAQRQKAVDLWREWLAQRGGPNGAAALAPGQGSAVTEPQQGG